MMFLQNIVSAQAVSGHRALSCQGAAAESVLTLPAGVGFNCACCCMLGVYIQECIPPVHDVACPQMTSGGAICCLLLIRNLRRRQWKIVKRGNILFIMVGVLTRRVYYGGAAATGMITSNGVGGEAKAVHLETGGEIEKM